MNESPELTLRSPEVFSSIVHAAATQVRGHMRTAKKHSHKTTLPTKLTLTLLSSDDDEESDAELNDELDEELPFIVTVEFLEEHMGWSSVVFKCLVSSVHHDLSPEWVAVKVRISEEEKKKKKHSDSSNARAYATMKALHGAGKQWMCPEPLHYVERVEIPPSTSFTPPDDPSSKRASLIPLSVVICTWIQGKKVLPLPSLSFSSNHNSSSSSSSSSTTTTTTTTTTTSGLPGLPAISTTAVSPGSSPGSSPAKSQRRAAARWKNFVLLHAEVSSIKKPQIGDLHPPKYVRHLHGVFDYDVHTMWLDRLDSRFSGLRYLYQSKKSQTNLLPMSLKFMEEKDNRGMNVLESLEYRLGAVLRKLRAIKRDDEDTQDMVLHVADCSLDNFVQKKSRNGGSQMTFIDLEASGWTDPAYSIAEFLYNNVWFDKWGLEEEWCGFTDVFQAWVVNLYISKLDIAQDRAKLNRFIERFELNKEFCAIKGLMFHLRGALLELGNIKDGFRVNVDTCGSGSGSGGGGKLCVDAKSPGNIYAMRFGHKRVRGRTSLTSFGRQMMFRGSHQQGCEMYRQLLNQTNYMRRVMGEFLTMHAIIDQVKDEERKRNEIELAFEKKKRKKLRVDLGLEEEEEEEEEEEKVKVTLKLPRLEK